MKKQTSLLLQNLKALQIHGELPELVTGITAVECTIEKDEAAALGYIRESVGKF